MLYKRMPIETESPEEIGYNNIQHNLSESSVKDLVWKDLNLSLADLKLEYIPHKGNEDLRGLLAQEAKVAAKDVLLTVGAAGALFIINTALLSKDDHLIVLRPNYATNIVVPETIGCAITYIDLTFENAWKPNLEQLKQAVQPNTKLISITSPHNPTGMLIEEQSIDDLIAFCEDKNIQLLVDETYRDTFFKTPYPICTSKSKHVISVASLSKAYGLPGLRMGWLITQNEPLMEQFLAAKEMIYITNSALDEAVAAQFYKAKTPFVTTINQRCSANFEALKKWFQQEQRLEVVLPQGGVVCFPRFKENLNINTDLFYKILLERYATFVGPGHWFGMSDRYMRIGFGWNETDNFEEGLKNISRVLNEIS